jgi:asparagine synthetase B (glutamine-hydrolysing)
MQEPFHSPNIYTHFKMRQQMKNAGVSVVLTGAGGDELLGGYEGEFWPQASAELRKSWHTWQAEKYDLARNYRNGGWKGLISGEGRRLKGLIRQLADKIGLLRLLRPYSKEDLTDAEKYKQLYFELSFHEQTSFHKNSAGYPSAC